MRQLAERLSYLPLDSISLNRRTDSSRHNQSQSRTTRTPRIIVCSWKCVNREVVPSPYHALAKHTSKLIFLLESHRGSKPGVIISCHDRTIVGSAVRFKLCSVFLTSRMALEYTVCSLMEPRHVFTVSELNTAARTTLEQGIGTVWVQGEVADLTRAPSGHLYFTLKDENSQLSSVRFKSRKSFLTPVDIEPGTEVLAQGTLTVYEPRGRYQFIVSIMQPLGAGALQRAFEKLKKKLLAEGLFAEEAKKALPQMPQSIGIITSPRGAALRDVESVLKRRWPLARVFLFPSTVQGREAPAELQRALDCAVRFSGSMHPLDVIILTRGGGSAEDLAAFNDESLARALHACPIPTLSAVGHEIDFSIADFVADRRAPTPSAAAELVAPDAEIVHETLAADVQRMHRLIRTKWRSAFDEYRLRAETCRLRSPQRRIETLEQRFDMSSSSILRSAPTRWNVAHESFRHWSEILRLSDPSLPLQRGYSLTTRAGESTPLRDASTLVPGDTIETQLANGRLTSHVKEVAPDES